MHHIVDTPRDLKARLDAERGGVPFLVYRDGAGTQRIVTLDGSREELTIGRAEECDIRVEGDAELSRLHALLTRRGGSWTVNDAGLSRNGTFLNAKRVDGHHILRDRDVLRAGITEMRFFDPRPESTRTVTARSGPSPPAISPAQRKVLVALCRPYKERSPFVKPASNHDIAAELVLSEETVKTHLRELFAIFGIGDLPRLEKRIRLVEQAFTRGLVSPGDLQDTAPGR